MNFVISTTLNFLTTTMNDAVTRTVVN